MKIILSSDFHLSYRQYGLLEREKDFYKRYNKMIDEIIKEKPDLFIQLGDIFDEPKPKPLAIKVFNDGIKKLIDNNIDIIGIIGNHTTLQIKDFYPIDCIFNENIRFLNNNFIVYDDLFIGGVNYHTKLQKNSIKEKIDNIYNEAKKYKTKILLLHQGLKNDMEMGYEFDEDELELNRFDYVFLGHIHKRILRKNDTTVYHYPGSINSCSVTELIDEFKQGKGYSIFDTENGEINYKNLTKERDFIDLNINDDKLNKSFIDDFIKSLSEYENKPMVRINCITKHPNNVYGFINKLEDLTLHINKNITKEYENQLIEKFDIEKMSIEKILKDKYKEEWKSDFIIDLFKKLSKGDIDSAKQISDNVYKKYYKGD